MCMPIIYVWWLHNSCACKLENCPFQTKEDLIGWKYCSDSWPNEVLQDVPDCSHRICIFFHNFWQKALFPTQYRLNIVCPWYCLTCGWVGVKSAKCLLSMQCVFEESRAQSFELTRWRCIKITHKSVECIQTKGTFTQDNPQACLPPKGKMVWQLVCVGDNGILLH